MYEGTVLRGLWLIFLAGCAASSVSPSLPKPAPEPSAATPARTNTASIAAAAYLKPLVIDTSSAAITSSAALAAIEHADEDEEEGEEPDDGSEIDQARAVSTSTAIAHLFRYSLDISDEDLLSRWKDAPETLGSIAIGFADEGRVINPKQCPADEGARWLVVTPEKAWGTAETIDYVTAAITRVKELHPNAPPLRVNNISARDGGYMRPHRSHQNGRDVDLGFYYPTVDPIRVRNRDKVIDVALNWELIKSLVILTDVEVIWVDQRIINVLREHALGVGEDPAWIDSIFNAGRRSILQHARRHRDHFHVRFYNGRAQELGRRVAPLLAQRPDQNMMMVRVKNGDTLGAIAMKYGSSVSAIQKANRMRNTFLRIAQVLRVPLRGPCTRCPIPPAIEVPPRRLPSPPAAIDPPAAVDVPAAPAGEEKVERETGGDQGQAHQGFLGRGEHAADQ